MSGQSGIGLLNLQEIWHRNTYKSRNYKKEKGSWKIIWWKRGNDEFFQ